MNAAGTPMPIPDLAGLLAKRPATAAVAAQPRRTANPANTIASTTPTREAPSPSAAGRTAADGQRTGREYLRSITVYLPRPVFQHLAETAVERGTTRTALILTAINTTHQNLHTALHRGAIEPARGGDLFTVPQARPPAEPSVQTTIRVTDTQLAALTQLAERHSVPRSHIITAALTLSFDPPEATAPGTVPLTPTGSARGHREAAET